MPYYKLRLSYIHLKENKLEIMQLIIGKLIKRGLKMRAFNFWVKVLVLIKVNFILPQIELLNQGSIPSFLTLAENLNQNTFSVQRNFCTISEQQISFLSIHNLHSIFNVQYLTTIEQFLFTAIDNICPIVLFNKKQQSRNLILLPIYSKFDRDLKLGLTWLTQCAKDLMLYPALNLENRLYMELIKALSHDIDSELIDLKMQYYSLAQKNKKYIQSRRYFF